MYSPFVMVLGNLISGVLFLLDEYTTSVHDYLSILTGCSLIFFPQFVCNIIRYKLCIYYKLTITFLFLNLVLGLLYQVGIIVHDYSYIRGSLLFNVMGMITYLLYERMRHKGFVTMHLGSDNVKYYFDLAKCWKPKRTVPEGAIYVHYKTMQELQHCERD